MSSFVSYSNLSLNFSALTAELFSIPIPNNIQEALGSTEWKKAVYEEINAPEKNQTWVMEELPRNNPTIGCKWIFTPNFNADGKLERYKARLVAKEYT